MTRSPVFTVSVEWATVADMRKTSEGTVLFIVELLLSDWTPQEVSLHWPLLREVCDALPEIPNQISVATVQRIAKEWELSAAPGGPRANSGGPREGSGGPRSGAGGARKGAGRPKGSGSKHPLAAFAHALMLAGFGYQDIASALRLRSRQHAMILCKKFSVAT